MFKLSRDSVKIIKQSERPKTLIDEKSIAGTNIPIDRYGMITVNQIVIRINI